MTKIEEQCVKAGVPLDQAKRIEEAVAGFDSDDLRQAATDELVAAYQRSYGTT